MSFLHPSFLYGLAAIAIPIIIHLFDFRRTKKVYFSNTRLLHQVKEATRSFYNLKRLLILLTRIFFIIFLVLTFAQPTLSPPNATGLKAGRVGIFIDNSYSMSNTVAQDESGLELAKAVAGRMIDLYPGGSEFIIQTAYDLKSAYLYVGKQEAKNYLAEIKFTAETRPLAEILARFKQTHEGMPPREILLISDFQQATLKPGELAVDSTVHLLLLPVTFATYTNLVVDTAFISNPFELNKSKTNLIVRLKNYADEDIDNIPVKVFMADRQLSVTSASVPARQQVDLTFNVGHDARSRQQGRIVIEDYPVAFDNALFFTLESAARVKVAQVLGDDPSPYITAVYGNETLFELHSMPAGNIDYRLLDEADLIVLNQVAGLDQGLALRLATYHQRGASILIVPAANQPIPAYRVLIGRLQEANLTADKVPLQSPDFTRPFFANILADKQDEVTMPAAKAVWSWGSDRNALLKFIDGRPYLSEVSAGLFVLASPLADDYSGFPVNALFVPVMYRIAANSRQNFSPLFHRLSEQEIILPVAGLQAKDIIKLVKDGREFIPDQKIRGGKVVMMLPGASMEAGHYRVEAGNITGPQPTIALNLETGESDIKPLPETGLRQAFKGFDYTLIAGAGQDEIIGKITHEFQGIALWRYFLALALLFLLIEALLIRLL